MRRLSVCVVALFVASVSPAFGQHSFTDTTPQPAVGSPPIRGGALRAMAVESRSLSETLGLYKSGETVVNEVVAKVSSGPVVVTWTGELLFLTAASDIVIGITAAQCLDGKACTTVGPEVISTPNTGSGVSLRNYLLVTQTSGVGGLTVPAQAEFQTGSLLPNKFYRFRVFVGHFNVADGATTRVRSLRVEAYAKAL